MDTINKPLKNLGSSMLRFCFNVHNLLIQLLDFD